MIERKCVNRNLANDWVNVFLESPGVVPQSNADGSLQQIDTGIARPFPIGPAPARLRGAGGATHVSDGNGDAMPDLLRCDDHGTTPETGASPTWTLHSWEPGGWKKTREIIAVLQGHPCELELHTLDTNRNGIADLVVPGLIKQGACPRSDYRTFRFSLATRTEHGKPTTRTCVFH